MTTHEPELGFWLDLEADGGLDPAARDRLERAVAERPELGRERRALASLHRELAASRLPVRPGFREQVLAALPNPVWQLRPAAAWRLPVALLAALLVASAVLMTGAMAAVEEGGTVLGLLGAVGDFVVTATLSGAGLLDASWQGLALGLAERLSAPGTVVFGVGILALDLLVLLQVGRSRRRREAEAAARR